MHRKLLIVVLASTVPACLEFDPDFDGAGSGGATGSGTAGSAGTAATATGAGSAGNSGPTSQGSDSASSGTSTSTTGGASASGTTAGTTGPATTSTTGPGTTSTTGPGTTSTTGPGTTSTTGPGTTSTTGGSSGGNGTTTGGTTGGGGIPAGYGEPCKMDSDCNQNDGLTCCKAGQCKDTCHIGCKNDPLICPEGTACAHDYCLVKCDDNDADCAWLPTGDFTCQHKVMGKNTLCEND